MKKSHVLGSLLAATAALVVWCADDDITTTGTLLPAVRPSMTMIRLSFEWAPGAMEPTNCYVIAEHLVKLGDRDKVTPPTTLTWQQFKQRVISNKVSGGTSLSDATNQMDKIETQFNNLVRAAKKSTFDATAAGITTAKP